MYVLDTNTLIYYFKGMGNVAANVLQRAPNDIGIPSVVLYELGVGVAKSNSPGKRRKQVETFVTAVNILPFNVEEASASALIRADLEKRGQPIGPYDILIAGTAMANGGTLVTHNVSEFARIENFLVEDWY